MMMTKTGAHCQVVRLNLPHAAAMAIFTHPCRNGEPVHQERFLLDRTEVAQTRSAEILYERCTSRDTGLSARHFPMSVITRPAEIKARKAFVADQFARNGCDIDTDVDFPETSIEIQTRAEADYFNYLLEVSESGNAPERVMPAASGDPNSLVAVHKLDPFPDHRMIQVRTLVFAEMPDAKTGKTARGISLETVDYIWAAFPNYMETHVTFFRNEVRNIETYYKKQTIEQTSVGFSLGIGVAAPSVSNESNISHDERVFENGKPKEEKKKKDPDKGNNGETGETGETGEQGDFETIAAITDVPSFFAVPVSFGLNFSSMKSRLIEKEMKEYKLTVGEVIRTEIRKVGPEPKWQDLEAVA